MAAAYAALVSVMRIIEKLHLHPHPPPISLHKEQIHSLTANITVLEEFLEAYNPHLGYSAEADPLEARIADAAYAAEDVIESHIVDRITNENISSDGSLYEGLEKVIQDMASIQKEAMEIRETMGLQLHHHTNSTPQESLRSTSIEHNSRSMVGVDDVLLQIKDNLTSHSRRLQIIPIVGMGGSGKTTLASNIYQDPDLIHDHFDVYAWATFSQEYSIPGIFSQILRKLQNNEVGQQLSEDDLGNMLHRCLFGRKYLIIMDDMWNIEAWEKVRWFFPDNEIGSRIVVTTRLSNLASEITGSNYRLEMRPLDEDDSWNLLSKTVYGENGCPIELEEIGKKIAKSCKGLPLSIVVVGGILAKSKHTREFWEYMEENLNSILSSAEDESCLKILHMSYKQLPLYLKPCFLYLGVFREDEVIRVSKLTRLWVAEGFLKPIKGKSLEEIAKEYLKDLTDRNLILIWNKGINGSIKECKIHDLLREFCLREAEKERFYVVGRQDGPHQGVTITQRRIVISNTSKKEDIDALQSVSLARSLIWDCEEDPPSLNLRLLRIFESSRSAKVENMCQLVNLRYLRRIYVRDDKSLSTLNRLWNLETLYVSGLLGFLLPIEIWCMPHIRHVVNDGCLRDAPSGSQNDIVLENLHTLRGVRDFKCSEEAVKRIPNVKKLGIINGRVDGWSCLNNLVCLHKLVSLNCYLLVKMSDSGKNLNFPQSLKKLNLRVENSDCWQDILEKIGSLPLLEKLTLKEGCFEEGKWETAEGQFQSLNYLQIFDCPNLKHWTMESSHFPRLERLHLFYLTELEEIPLQFAEIPTLGWIELVRCKASAAISARRIVEEQEESNGEATIQVRVTIYKKNEAVESLAIHRNIQVEVVGLDFISILIQATVEYLVQPDVRARFTQILSPAHLNRGPKKIGPKKHDPHGPFDPLRRQPKKPENLG